MYVCMYGMYVSMYVCMYVGVYVRRYVCVTDRVEQGMMMMMMMMTTPKNTHLPTPNDDDGETLPTYLPTSFIQRNGLRALGAYGGDTVTLLYHLSPSSSSSTSLVCLTCHGACMMMMMWCVDMILEDQCL